MPKPLNAEQLKYIGRGFELHLGDEEARSYAGLIEETLASYARLDQLVELALPVKYPRSGDYRPGSDENALNAWYWKWPPVLRVVEGADAPSVGSTARSRWGPQGKASGKSEKVPFGHRMARQAAGIRDLLRARPRGVMAVGWSCGANALLGYSELSVRKNCSMSILVFRPTRCRRERS